MSQENIHFRIIEGDDLYELKIGKPKDNDSDNIVWSYVDTSHPMNLNEVKKLRDYLSDFLWKKLNEGL